MPRSQGAAYTWLLVCFVLSGAAGLVYQTAWSQRFAQVFGASELAVATVLAAYMGGLTLGAGVAGRWASRVRRPIVVYAVLELAIAVTALAVPWGLQVANRVQLGLLGGLETPPDAGAPASAVFHLVAAFVILLPPTAMMGATLPLLARQAIARDEQLGPRISGLYTANTLGAAAGALGGAYLLLPWVGLRHTVWIAAALNGVVFLAALALDRSRRAADASVPTDSSAKDAPPTVAATASTRSRGRWILPVILLSGVVSFTYEVLWTRLLTHVLGASVYAFGAMLATFLVGLALGSGLAGRWAQDRERARGAFAWAQIGITAGAVLAFWLLDLLPHWLERQGSSTEGWRPLLLATPILLPGAVAIGATFPLAVRILAGSASEAAPASARVFAWNTVGAIVGAVAAGFVTLPSLGYTGTLLLAAATSLGLALVAATVETPRRRPTLALASIGLSALVLWRPQPPWRILTGSPLGPAQGEVTYYSVGRSANVLLLDLGHGWRLTTNGLPEALIRPQGSRVGQPVVARWLTLLPALLRPDARDLMVIGLGGGVALEEVPPSITRIDVVELEPEVVAANRHLATERRKDPLADPRLRVVVNDARSALLLADRRYDLVVSQPSHPWTAGASHLFTRELFTLAHDRLTEDGVFLQWIGLPFIDEALLRSLVGTLTDVFPEVEVYLPTPQAALFVASRAPLWDHATVERALAATTPIWSDVGLHLPDDVQLRRWTDTSGARRLAEGAPRITDGINLLQTRSPRIRRGLVGRQAKTVLAEVDPLPQQRVDGFYTTVRLVESGQLERAHRLLATLDGAEQVAASAVIAAQEGRRRDAVAAAGRALALAPETTSTWDALLWVHRSDLAAGRALSFADALDRRPESVLVQAWQRATQEDWDGLEALDRSLATLLDPRRPITQGIPVLRAEWRLASGDPQAAREALELLDRSGAQRPRALLLRAQAALGCDDGTTAGAALAELVQGLEHGTLPSAFAAEVSEMVTRFEALQTHPHRAERLRQRLQQRLLQGAG